MGDSHDLDELRAALDRILAQLTRLGAPVVERLQPGLAEGEIVAAFRDLPFVPPRELRALYAWHNGTASEEDFFPDYVFLSLGDAVADYREWCRVAENVAEANISNAAQIWNGCWFPIFRPNDVTRYVAHCPDHFTDTAPIRIVDVEASADDVAYTSLTHMMRVFADCYETGAYSLHPDGLFADEAKAGDIRRAYARARAESGLEALRQGVTGEALNQAIHDVLDLHETRAVEPLLALLGTGDVDIRLAAIFPLGILGDERAIAPLLAIVAAGHTMPEAVRASPFAYAFHALNRAARMDSLTRVEAIDAVEQIAERTGQPLPVAPFLSAMGDLEPMVRMRAAARLGTSGDARALPALVAALNDDDQRAPYAAIQALGQLGDPGALEPLRRFAALQDSDPRANLRPAALEAIARIEAVTSGGSGSGESGSPESGG